jgi:hypothetical protein
MNIVFDPKDYPKGRGSLAAFIKDEIPFDSLLKIVDGRWSCRIGANWYSRERRSSKTENFFKGSRVEHFHGWYFYCNLMLTEAGQRGWGAMRGFAPDQSLDFVKGHAAAVIVNASIKPIWDSPDDIRQKKREEIAGLITKLDLFYPALPNWAIPLPVAVFGEGMVAYREIIGRVFCAIDDEFAAEVFFEAWLHSREPTSTEMQQIEELLA